MNLIISFLQVRKQKQTDPKKIQKMMNACHFVVVLGLCREFPWPFNCASPTESVAMCCKCLLLKWQQPDLVRWKYWLWICYGLIHLSPLRFLSLCDNTRSSLLNDGSFHHKHHRTENWPIHQLTLLVCVCVGGWRWNCGKQLTPTHQLSQCTT